MSHVVLCSNFVITDLESFKAACTELGLLFKENQKTYKWYGRWVNDYSKENAAYLQGVPTEDYGKNAVHVVSTKDNTAYQIGLHKNPNGEGFVMVYDFYGHYGSLLEKEVGKDANKLKDRYNVILAEKAAKRAGLKTKRTEEGDKIVLKVRK